MIKDTSPSTSLPSINFDALSSESDTTTLVLPESDSTEVVKRKRGRPRKEASPEMIPVSSSRELNVLESNTPYINSYEDSQNQLKKTVMGIDVLATQIEQDLQAVRASRTLKNKYGYICDLSSTVGSLMGNRIAAIREINYTITNAHKLEMERAKQVKAAAIGQDDDKAIMDMYKAYVNTPIGTIPNMPSNINVPAMILNNPNNAVPITSPTAVYTNDESGYNQFLNTPSPALNAIQMEQNPNIKPVVVYNQETNEMFFDVQDVITGQSYPNIQPPDPKLLEGLKPDLRNGLAKNLSAGLTYDLRLVGNRKFNEF